MLIRFTCDENSVESSDFVQATLDFYYDEFLKIYVKRFIGQISVTDGNVVVRFIENNSMNLFTINIIDGNNQIIETLENAKLTVINEDLINDFCRIEIKTN